MLAKAFVTGCTGHAGAGCEVAVWTALAAVVVADVVTLLIPVVASFTRLVASAVVVAEAAEGTSAAAAATPQAARMIDVDALRRGISPFPFRLASLVWRRHVLTLSTGATRVSSGNGYDDGMNLSGGLQNGSSWPTSAAPNAPENDGGRPWAARDRSVG